MSNIYTYVDYTGFLSEVGESELNFAGTWRSTANYYRFDVVDYGQARYVCTTANTNTAPPYDLQFTTFWSIIAFTSTGTGSSGTNSGGGVDNTQMVQDVYSLAYRAYNIALTGTDLPTPGALDPWVMQWIGHTYNIARAGTNAANSADMWARDAYHLAVAGTNAANSADRWGRDAFSIAVTGTNAANQAYSIALQALYAAWNGTNSSNFPAWVLGWLGQTYNLAVAGTTAANAVDTTARIALNTAWAGTDAANSADMWARDAFSIAVSGTNAANSAWSYAGQAWNIAVAGTNSAAAAQGAADAAYSIAQQALTAAWAGTNLPISTAGTVPQWVMEWIGHTANVAYAGTNAADSAWSYAGQAWNIAVSGTNAANSADSWARDAYSLAVTGTDSANQAYSIALQALYAAWNGTNNAGPGGSGTVPSWVMDWLTQTYNISVAGTNAANQSYSLAMQALQMAWVGTNTPTPGPGGGSGTVPVWVMDWLSQTYNLSVAGTNAANQADSLARDAYRLAVTGTNAANQVYSLATLALNTAWAGTNSSGSVNTDNLVRITGDTMTGTLGAKSVYLQHGTQTYNGTIVIDFLDQAYKTVFLNSSTAFDGTNYGANTSNRTVVYRLFSGASSRNLTFNSRFVCLREKPVSIPSSKIAIASFTCFGTTADDVVFAYAEQS